MTSTRTSTDSRSSNGTNYSPVMPHQYVLPVSSSLKSHESTTPITLQTLLEGKECIDGQFEKLIASNAASVGEWKMRYFVFEAAGCNVYLFKSGRKGNAVPVTYLPATGCVGTIASNGISNDWLLTLTGNGANPQSGETVRRQWTLRCHDEQVYHRWLHTIGNRLEAPSPNPHRLQRSSSFNRAYATAAISFPSPSETQPVPQQLHRSNSKSSSRSLGFIQDMDHHKLELEFRAMKHATPTSSGKSIKETKSFVGKLTNGAKKLFGL